MRRRAASTIVLLAACRFNFDPLGAPSDGAGGDDTGDTLLDTSSLLDMSGDATSSPLVQAVKSDNTSGAPITINGGSGLTPVTAGNMVLVVCGGFNSPGLCTVSSTPATTWTNIDPGSTLGVYVACNAPAITSITISNGAQRMNMVVTEWSGVVASAGCFDQKRISTPCATAPTAWDTQLTPTVSQNRELLVAVTYADAANAGWTIDPPYQMGFNATGVNAAVNVMVGYQQVNAPPMPYSATGTVNSWQFACFSDVFTFKAQ